MLAASDAALHICIKINFRCLHRKAQQMLPVAEELAQQAADAWHASGEADQKHHVHIFWRQLGILCCQHLQIV